MESLGRRACQKLFHHPHHVERTATTQRKAQAEPYDWASLLHTITVAPIDSSSGRMHQFGPGWTMHIADYVEQRQAVQDKLITAILREDWTPQYTTTPSPWVIFTCGAMGSGKSHVLTWMRSVSQEVL